jgi:cobalt-zinc-cadmium efflux system outer membrane protein
MLAWSLTSAAFLCAPLAPPIPSGVSAEFQEPSGRITLPDALRAALLGSPRLAALSPEIAAREADALQSMRRPNPELGVELENIAGSGGLEGFSSTEATLAISQVFELGGKRGRRGALAAIERDLAGWDYEIERTRVLAETTRRFVQVVSAQERAKIAEELVQVAESTLTAVAQRVSAGASSPVERSRARVELETNRVDAEQVRRALTSGRHRLAAVWGSASPVFSEAIGPLETVSSPPDWETLRARVATNPALRRWAAELEMRKSLLALERARGVPDLEVAAGARWLAEPQAAALVVGVGLPLPVFDRNRSAARAVEHRIVAGDAELKATEIEIESELSSAYQSLAAAYAEATALREDILPEARATFDQAGDAYRQGLLRLTDVLDAERSLFELRGRYVDALARYHESFADLEELLGSSLKGALSEGGDE